MKPQYYTSEEDITSVGKARTIAKEYQLRHASTRLATSAVIGIGAEEESRPKKKATHRTTSLVNSGSGLRSVTWSSVKCEGKKTRENRHYVSGCQGIQAVANYLGGSVMTASAVSFAQFSEWKTRVGGGFWQELPSENVRWIDTCSTYRQQSSCDSSTLWRRWWYRYTRKHCENKWCVAR